MSAHSSRKGTSYNFQLEHIPVDVKVMLRACHLSPSSGWRGIILSMLNFELLLTGAPTACQCLQERERVTTRSMLHFLAMFHQCHQTPFAVGSLHRRTPGAHSTHAHPNFKLCALLSAAAFLMLHQPAAAACGATIFSQDFDGHSGAYQPWSEDQAAADFAVGSAKRHSAEGDMLAPGIDGSGFEYAQVGHGDLRLDYPEGAAQLLVRSYVCFTCAIAAQHARLAEAQHVEAKPKCALEVS